MREFCRIAPDVNRDENSHESDLGCNSVRLLQEFSFLTESEPVVHCNLGTCLKTLGTCMKNHRDCLSKYALLWACGLVVLLAVSTTARADSIVYNVSGAFANGQQLTGQVTWNSTLSTVTGSVLTLSGSTFNQSCTFGCGAVLKGFWGTGSLSKSYEILVGGLQPNNSLFALTVYTGRGFKGQDFKIFDTRLSWSRVAVPEESLGADLLVSAAFALMLPFGPLNRFRKSGA